MQRDPVPATLELATLRQLGARTSRDLVAESIDIFHRETPPGLRRLRSALAESDTETLVETAHRLKGGVVNVGAKRMSWLCGMLEEAGRGGLLGRAKEILRDIEREHQRVQEVLEEYQIEEEGQS